MTIPCKGCGEVECKCKYILAKALLQLSDYTDVPQYAANIAEYVVWNTEREV